MTIKNEIQQLPDFLFAMKKYSFIPLTVLVFLYLNTSSVSAQEINPKITSIFLYNFTKYIKWPATAETGDFVIGIMDDSLVETELQRMAARVKVGGTRNIVLRKIAAKDVSAVQGCHILYVSRTAIKSLKHISAEVGTEPVLLVTEGMGLANKGSAISLYIDEESDKMKVELSKKALEKSQLRASSDLLALAVVL